MKKKFQIFLMVLSLGLFVMPKQNLFAQNSTMDCCKTEHSTNSNCHGSQKQKNSDCSKNHGKDGSCTSHCCTNCYTCSISLIPVVKPEINKTEIHKISTVKISVYNYSDPFISTALQEIWQPPKIG